MEEFEFGDLRFIADSGEIIGGGTRTRLEPKPAAVLKCLCLAPGRVVRRQQLLDECWGEGLGSDEALTQCIAQVRRALQEVGQPPSLVETRARVGYRFLPPGSAPATRPRKRWPLAVAAGVIVTLLALWAANPHRARHFVRHSLGLYQPG